MSTVFLVIGTIFAIVFIIFLFKGQKYDELLDALEGEAFPMKSIYSVGLALQDMKPVRLQGDPGEKLRKASTLYYSQNYSEFYARISWAQALSFSVMAIAVFFTLAGLLRDMAVIFGLLGIVSAVLAFYYFFTYTEKKISDRKDECEQEFPNAISKLALLVNSGVILHDAWEMVAYGKEGVIYDLMKDACEAMSNGVSDVEAIHAFGVKTNSDDIKKFVSALIQNVERGGDEFLRFMANQSSALWNQKRQITLQKGEKAAGKLLMPIALMFVGVMLIVISAALSSVGF